MSTPLLELKDFKYSYGNIEVIHGIDLKVDVGECVTIIGANGACKTTTLQAISGLLSPRGVRGEILFEGRPIQNVSGNRIARIGIAHVLEGRHVFSKLSVQENLVTGAYVRRDGAAALQRDLKDIFRRFPRLEERKSQLAGTLSGGEQQMLAIARSLIARPKLILMDEPSLGLAPLIVKEVFDAVRQIHEEGTTILFVEQNSRIALNTAQRGYVLQNGEIVLEDSCEALLNNEDVQKAYLGT